MCRREPVRVQVRVLGRVGPAAMPRSRAMRPRLTRPLIEGVHIFLFEALLQVGHAGVRVLPVVAAGPAAVARRGGGHSLEGLRR